MSKASQFIVRYLLCDWWAVGWPSPALIVLLCLQQLPVCLFLGHSSAFAPCTSGTAAGRGTGTGHPGAVALVGHILVGNIWKKEGWMHTHSYTHKRKAQWSHAVGWVRWTPLTAGASPPGHMHSSFCNLLMHSQADSLGVDQANHWPKGNLQNTQSRRDPYINVMTH